MTNVISLSFVDPFWDHFKVGKAFKGLHCDIVTFVLKAKVVNFLPFGLYLGLVKK